MPATMKEDRTYVLGSADRELDRLQRQSDFYGALTGQALRLAGIQTGMRVLDCGCGAGDVSIQIAQLVGPSGEVIAVDRSADALARATSNFERANVHNVHLLNEDLATLQLDAPVDAVVGRFILMHLPDPVAVLRNLTAGLSDAGIVLFQEMDIGVARAEPPVPLLTEMATLICQAFARSGVDYRPGLRLHDQFVEAGLPAPELVSLGRVEAAPAPESAALMTAVLTTLLPAVEATGLSSAVALDLDTLPNRLMAAVNEQGSLVTTPPIIAAWTRIDASC